MIFVNALQTEDSKTALECLTEASRKAIVNENPQGSWILQLAAQTRDFSPKVSKTEWVIRNQKARVYYLDSTGSKNHLTLIRDQERFYIHLKTPAKQVFESLKEIHYGPRTLSN